eukprot:jgi/Picsp_1/6341/NSC_03690-R1_rossmann-fold nad -binding domain-containing protein
MRYSWQRCGKIVCQSDNDKADRGNIGDELLDFMYAGKKLRKWYGQEGQVLPRESSDGNQFFDGDGEEDDLSSVVRDKVVVLFPDEYAMAEQSVLQLILLRAPVVVVVQDVSSARSGFGSYVEAVRGDPRDASGLRKVFKSAMSTIVCGKLDRDTVAILKKAGVPNIVMLSAVNSGEDGFLSAVFGWNQEMKILKDPAREDLVIDSGVPCTIIRIAGLSNAPAGSKALDALIDTYPTGEIPREDIAAIMAKLSMETGAATNNRILAISSTSAVQKAGSLDLDALLKTGLQ